jgi:hypothetical protein
VTGRSFSDRIGGLGHIDAAPYGCSKLQSAGCKYNCACHGDAAVARMLTYAQGSAAAGRIAALGHVKAAKVWVMSGGADTIVNHTVGAAAADLYRQAGADVIFHIVPGAEHAFVTDNNSSGVANSCGHLGAPFINVSDPIAPLPSTLSGVCIDIGCWTPDLTLCAAGWLDQIGLWLRHGRCDLHSPARPAETAGALCPGTRPEGAAICVLSGKYAHNPPADACNPHPADACDAFSLIDCL